MSRVKTADIACKLLSAVLMEAAMIATMINEANAAPKIPNADLRALQVLKDREVLASSGSRLSNGIDQAAVCLVVPVREVEPHGVDARID